MYEVLKKGLKNSPSFFSQLLQEELSKALYKKNRTVPFDLHQLKAQSFLDAPKRAILFPSVMNFSKIMSQLSTTLSDDKKLGLLRCTILIIEAALPVGSIDTTANASWKPENASYWRSMVMKATTPGALMGCIILLESNLSKDWLRPNAEHLLSCLPRPWKAIEGASISSVSLRLQVLDRGIKYGLSHEKDDDEWETFDEKDE